MLQIYSAANLVAGSLCGIGCAIYAGPIGVLGAVVSLYWICLQGWLLARVRL